MKYERIQIQIKSKKELEALGINLPFKVRGVQVYEGDNNTYKTSHLEIYGSEKFDIFSLSLSDFPKGSYAILDGDKVIINNKEEYISKLTHENEELEKKIQDALNIAASRLEIIAKIEVQNKELQSSLLACQNELKLAKEPRQSLIAEDPKDKKDKQ